MFIVDSLRSEIVNVDCVTSICFDRKGTGIVANMINEDVITLGTYSNPQRAACVLDQMLAVVFPDSMKMIKGFENEQLKAAEKALEKPVVLREKTLADIPEVMVHHEIVTYYMPEE